MNDQNIEDLGKYVSKKAVFRNYTDPLQTDIRACKFLVDTYYPGSGSTELEPHYILDTENWEKVTCAPFLDAARTHMLARTIWLPNMPFIPPKFQRHWGEHCLLKKTVKA